VTGQKSLGSELTSRLLAGTTKVTGQPVLVAARINVVGMSTFIGAALLIWVGTLIWSYLYSQFGVALAGTIFSFVLEYTAWLGLRRRGGPLRFGPSGGVIAVSETTLFIVQVNHFTGRQTKLLGSWPREEVSMTPVVNRLNRLRLFDLHLPASEAPCRLELVQTRNRDAVLLALFPGARSA
jgi:hypothetical protein